MKKANYLKMIFLLWGLIAGIGSVSAAEDYDYEWVKTNFSDLATGDIVVLVDNSYSIALPNEDTDFRGVSVTVSGTKLSGTVADDIQWKLTKGGSTVKLSRGNAPLSATTDIKLKVGSGASSDFYYDDGQLCCTVNSKSYYIVWSDAVDFYRALLQEGKTGSNYLGDFTFYKKVPKNYVKWKKVDFSTIDNDDVLAIVDVTTANAMSNDKGADKAPAVVAVELNADKDRISGSVADNIQWIGNAATDGKSFITPSDAEKMLIGISDGLRVGGTSDGSSVFSFTNNFLSTSVDSKTYYAGLEAGFMSNTWELLEAGEKMLSVMTSRTHRLQFSRKLRTRRK